MAFQAGYQGAIYVMGNAASVALTNELLTDSGDHTTFVEANSTRIYWDDTAVPVVQTSPDGITWTTQSPTLYTVQYVGGKIIWNSAQPAGTQVRLSSGGKYFAYSTLAQGTDWEFSGARDFVDISVLGGGRARQWAPLMLTGTFTIKLFYIDNTLLNNLTTGFRAVLSGVTPSGKRFESFMLIKDDKLHAAFNAIIDEQLSFQVTGLWYLN